ncbi:MAG: hypothetical protein AAGF12_18460 [Myxococcota bacterium]
MSTSPEGGSGWVFLVAFALLCGVLYVGAYGMLRTTHLLVHHQFGWDHRVMAEEDHRWVETAFLPLVLLEEEWHYFF